MKYLAIGYDGNEEVLRVVEADNPSDAALRIKEESLFSSDGNVSWLVETPASVHHVDYNGDITSSKLDSDGTYTD